MDDASYLQIKEQSRPAIENFIKSNINPTFRFSDKPQKGKTYTISLIPLVFLIMYLMKPSFIMDKDDKGELKINYIKFIFYSSIISTLIWSILNYAF